MNDLKTISFYTATLLAPSLSRTIRPVCVWGGGGVTDDTAGVCGGEGGGGGVSDDIICSVMRLPGLYAWLLGSSALGVWVERDKTGQMGVNIKTGQMGVNIKTGQMGVNIKTGQMGVNIKTGQMGVNIKETHVGPEYRQWNVCLFKLDAIWIQMGSPVAVKAVRNIGNNGRYDPLLSCWIKLGIGGEDGMEIMWRDHDARGDIYRPGGPNFHLVQLLWRSKVIVFMLLSGVSFTLFL